MKDIKLVNLLSGEDLIAKVEFLGVSDMVRLTKPFRIMIQPPPQGGQNVGIGFAPWPPFIAESQTTVELQRAHVKYVVDALPDFVSNYMKLTSGLVLPGQNRGPADGKPNLRLVA
jgi:hypothetical protein